MSDLATAERTNGTQPKRRGRPPKGGGVVRASQEKKRPPTIGLVKVDPPAPPEKKRKPKISELVRPCLEEILVNGDRDWYRVVLFHSATQAAFNINRVRTAYSKTEWEWESRSLPEVDQSAIYVKWVGHDRALL